MYFDKDKQCFVNDDGSKMKPTVSLTRYYLTCDHNKVFKTNQCVENREGLCYQAYKRLYRWHNYLAKELSK